MSETCFIDLGICDVLKLCCLKKGWLRPTAIQSSAIPRVIEGCDVVGLSETGSGKTGAFILPILELWLRSDKPKGYALIILPTRELAKQIFDEFQSFFSFIKEIDKDISMDCICLIGGEEMISQKLILARGIQNFIIDEADLMLNMQFREAIDDILKLYEKPMSKRKEKRKSVNPANNQIEKFPHPQTHLYSATMTKDVQKLRRAALRFDAAYVYGLSTDDNVKLPENLSQFFIPVQILDKHIILDYVIEKYSKIIDNDEKSSSKPDYKVIVFCNRINESNRVSTFLKERGYSVYILTGKTPQESRTKAFKKFSSEGFSILVCTDVASRGLDFKNIGLVINYEVPVSEKCYRHRIGRTARAGEKGESLTFVSRDCATTFLEIESQLAKVMSKDGIWCMPKWPESKIVENGSLLKKQRIICEPVWRSANKCIRDIKEQRYQKKRELLVCEGEILSDLSEDYSSLSDSDVSDDSRDSNEKKDYVTGKSGIEAANRQYRSLKKERKRKKHEKELQSKKHKQEYSDILKKDDDDVDKGHLSFKPILSDKIAKLN